MYTEYFSDIIHRIDNRSSDVLPSVPFLPLNPFVDQGDEQCPLRIVSRLFSRLYFQLYKKLKSTNRVKHFSGNKMLTKMHIIKTLCCNQFISLQYTT